DAGKVISEYGNAEYQKLNPFDDEQGLHMSYGGGFRIALNENFIVAVDYGMAKDALDGNSGLYIGLGYLY
ncbi:MAG: hypothetical protein GWP19_14275, partial [Planctomycetia bacterium]|nr:hypothetical protein [Planctomycetia bacterium]